MLFICQVMMIIVNWFHFNSVKNSVCSATINQ